MQAKPIETPRCGVDAGLDQISIRISVAEMRDAGSAPLSLGIKL